MKRIFPAVLLISILALPAFSQGLDSLRLLQESDTASIYTQSQAKAIADTLVLKQPDYSHSSSKAILYALVLPGLGQAYNKKYYKIPIVLAALGGVGYAIVYNTNQYQEASLNYVLTPDDETEFYLRAWRKNVERSYIGLIVVYALQMLDAYVDAQLYNWDVNENLSLRVAPSLQPLMVPTSRIGQSYGITCSFNLKGR